MIRTNILLSVLSAGILVACGGPTKTTTTGNKQLAENAPPVPAGEVSQKIDREVSREDSKDFKSAVVFFKKKAKQGWSEQSCKDASERFSSIVDANPKMIEARFNAGLALQNCGMNKAAEKEYQKALRINSGHAASLSNLGEIYFEGGNEVRAKEYWERAVKAYGKIVAARNNLAWLMIRDVRSGKSSLKSKEKAITDMLSRALAVDNNNVEAYTLYGLLFLEGAEKNKSRLTLAKLLLETGAKINPKYAPLQNAFGLLQLKRDNVPQALESFRRAVSLDPNFLEASRNIGNIVLDFRKYDEAKRLFTKVLKLNSKDYESHIGMGYALRGLKDFKGAEDSYKSARKIDGSRPEADYNSGVLYQDFLASGTEDLRKAQGYFRKASNYFKSAMGKPKANRRLKKEASLNIKTCDKNVKSLEQAIKFAAQMKENS